MAKIRSGARVDPIPTARSDEELRDRLELHDSDGITAVGDRHEVTDWEGSRRAVQAVAVASTDPESLSR
ncbi:hypothetical protein ACFL59_03095 [Planctomycetota bacterium]